MTPQEKYKKSTCKQIKLELNKNTEADLIAWLDAKPNKAGYIKSLIKADKEKISTHEG